MGWPNSPSVACHLAVSATVGLGLRPLGAFTWRRPFVRHAAVTTEGHASLDELRHLQRRLKRETSRRRDQYCDQLMSLTGQNIIGWLADGLRLKYGDCLGLSIIKQLSVHSLLVTI